VTAASVAAAAASARILQLRPLAISAGLRNPLGRCAPMVLAAHRLGASLGLPGCEDAVFMSAPGHGLLPAHIVVRARDLIRVLRAAGDDMDSVLHLRLDTQGVRTFHTRLPAKILDSHSSRAQANIAALAASLRTNPARLGLGQTAAEILGTGARWRDFIRPSGGEPQRIASTLRALIGRGAGTTPAGDDFLVGMLACIWSMQGQCAPLIRALRAMAPELETLTTTTGATYLRAATRGEFGSHLLVWVRALPQVSRARALALAERVASHGATSGYDALTGFIAAAEAVRDHAGS